MKKKYFNSRLNLVELTNPLYWVLIVFISVFTSFKTAAQRDWFILRWIDHIPKEDVEEGPA